MPDSVKVFALSTCIHCKKAKEFLDKHNIAYDSVHVDTLSGKERTECIDELKLYNPALSFPTTVIDKEKVVVGYNEDDLCKILKITP